MSDIAALAKGILSGKRRAVGKGITLVESESDADLHAQEALLQAVLPHAGKALRIGVSGTPGVGKSTFIEALGLAYIAAGHKVSVLAVDPSSPVTQGSILGDKTRMEELMREENAFIRPSPSRGTLGGVAQKTHEVMLLLEAAGYDVVLIETVGVGQSESTVNDIVDTFVLLMQPGAGDELQGIKRGVLELADIVVVNKADGTLLAPARNAKQKLDAVLNMFTQKAHEGREPALLCSAQERTGIDEVQQAIARHQARLQAQGAFADKRGRQAEAMMWRAVEAGLRRRFVDNATVRAKLPAMEQAVHRHERTPAAAAAALLDSFFAGDHGTGESGPE